MIHAVRFLAASNESGDNRIVTKKILVTGATGTIGRIEQTVGRLPSGHFKRTGAAQRLLELSIAFPDTGCRKTACTFLLLRKLIILE